MVTPEQLHILQHSLGVDQYGRGEQYRNHYVAGEGHHSWEHLQALVEAGLMVEIKRYRGELAGGDALFIVTDAGKAAMEPVDTRPAGRYTPCSEVPPHACEHEHQP